MEMYSKTDWYIGEHFECYTEFVFVSSGETMWKTTQLDRDTRGPQSIVSSYGTSAHCICYEAQPSPPVATSPEISDNPPSTTS